jgi:cell division protein FtsN
MSNQSHESDRAAAYRGLILGAIAIAVLIVTIVKLTNAKYASESPAKTSSTAVQGTSNWALDA